MKRSVRYTALHFRHLSSEYVLPVDNIYFVIFFTDTGHRFVLDWDVELQF